MCIVCAHVALAPAAATIGHDAISYQFQYICAISISHYIRMYFFLLPLGRRRTGVFTAVV